jgi:hypothetical protein
MTSDFDHDQRITIQMEHKLKHTSGFLLMLKNAVALRQQLVITVYMFHHITHSTARDHIGRFITSLKIHSVGTIEFISWSTTVCTRLSNECNVMLLSKITSQPFRFTPHHATPTFAWIVLQTNQKRSE